MSKAVSFVVGLSLLSFTLISAQTTVTLSEKTPSSELRTLAQRGNLDAMCLLGERLLAEMKTEADVEEGVAWIKRAADSGAPFANYKMACLYDVGIGLSKDPDKCLEYIRICAAQGFEECQFSLGRRYEFGDSASSIKRDIQESISWLLKAANNGHFAAMRELAYIFSASGEVERNVDTARKWLGIGGLLGDPQCAYDLAYSFLRADISKTDSIRAFAWFSLASSDSTSNDKVQLADCILMRDSLGARLTPVQRESAQNFFQMLLDKRKELQSK